MGKIEKRVLDWIQQHLFVIFCVAITLCSMLIRFSFRDFVSGDSRAFLLPWWEEIHAKEGIYALKEQVGNYNMLYQFLIAIMTYLPIKPLYEYKILSIIFDYLLAITVGYMIYDILDRDRYKGGLAYAAVIMSPIVILNSSAWAQCDAIYVFSIVLSLLFMFRERYILSFIMFGIAFSFKLQAVFILPFFIFLYFYKKKFSALNFLLIPLMMCVTAIPSLIMGRGIGEIFENYFAQIDTYTSLAINYPSVWVVFNNAVSPETLKVPAIIVTVSILGVLMYMWLSKGHDWGRREMLYAAFIMAYTCVLFLPKMHERYGYLYEILAIAIAFINKKTILLCIVLNTVSMVTYGSYLYDAGYNARILAVVNGLTYIFYLFLLMPGLLKRNEAMGERQKEGN